MRCQRLVKWGALVASTVVALLVAGTLALAGRGGSGTSTTTKSASPPSPAAAPTPTPSLTLAAAPWRPGSDSLAQTAAVARQWLRLLHSEAFASSHLWAKDVHA